jgi:hypothetical protein
MKAQLVQPIVALSLAVYSLSHLKSQAEVDAQLDVGKCVYQADEVGIASKVAVSF